MNRMTSDKQSGVKFLYLCFCCTPKFKFSCKAIEKTAQFHQTVEKILCNSHWKKTGILKLQKVSQLCEHEERIFLSGLLTLKPSDIVKIST